MLKYYIFLFLIAGAALVYIYREDPCNRKLRIDFSTRYPDYELLDTGPGEGGSAGAGAFTGGENVYCYIQYKKPDSEQTYEDIWLYQDSGSSWNFSEIRTRPVD